MNFSICRELLNKFVGIRQHIIYINRHSTRKLIRVKYYDFDMYGSDFQFNETKNLTEVARIFLSRNINYTTKLFVFSFEN